MHLRYTLPLRVVEPSSPVGMKAGLCSVLLKSGFPVPDGFCVTTRTYRKFIQENGIESLILDQYHQTDLSDLASIQELSNDVAKLIMEAPIPESMAAEFSRMYKSIYLSEGIPPEAAEFSNKEQIRVTVRASVQDKHSFAGVFSTHEARGSKSLVEAVKAVWASLHSPKAIIYRNRLRINHDMDMGVLVQKSLDLDKSGTAITGSSSLIIESVPGPSHLFLYGEVEADMHLLQSNILTNKRIIPKIQMLSRDKTGNLERVSCNIEEPILTDNEVFKISTITQNIHEKFGFPQIIEWGISGGKVFVLQTRPHTFSVEIGYGRGGVINGLPVSRGYVSGVLTNEFPEKFESKFLMVCSGQSIAPVLVSSGVITENGGYGSHSALLARELEMPAVFAAHGAMQLNGKKIAIDGFEGAAFLTESLKIDPESFKTKTLVVKEESKPLVEEEYVFREPEILQPEPVQAPIVKAGVWIDTPADALNAQELLKEAHIVFVDVVKMAKLALGRDYSPDKLSHRSVLSLVKAISEQGKPVHFFWKTRPVFATLNALEEYGTHVFFPERRE